MKQISLLILAVLIACLGKAQTWVDTLYQVQDQVVVYGAPIDFAGNTRHLEMDITVPVGDVAPACGRPLMVIIHGGAWMGGTKNDPVPARLREDFAKRGYVTASINYRLGMFQTATDWHCNVSHFGLPWDCMNQTDTLEWHRALYRGIQDAKGAIRYLVNNHLIYQIDPDNVFVVGESAGAFIALGVGYMDVAGEKPPQAGAVATAPAPNNRYESLCVQAFGLDTNIASMQLPRPDLGPIDGTLNLPGVPYRIRGVGSFYGGMYTNLFADHANDAEIPALYMYHQTNDLIVAYNRRRLLDEFSLCLEGVCGGLPILNRPWANGSDAIADMIDALAQQTQPVPDYMVELIANPAPCLQQFTTPSTAGHQLDNYWLRTTNMATFFAARIDTAPPCGVGVEEERGGLAIRIYPNPSQGDFIVEMARPTVLYRVYLADLMGRIIYEVPATSQARSSVFHLRVPEGLARGTYLLRIETARGRTTRRVVFE